MLGTPADGFGHLNGMTHILNRGHGPGAQISPEHDSGVHFNLTGRIEKGTPPGIEGRVVFQVFDHLEHGFYGIIRFPERFHTDLQGFLHSELMIVMHASGNIPGAAVNKKHGFGFH